MEITSLFTSFLFFMTAILPVVKNWPHKIASLLQIPLFKSIAVLIAVFALTAYALPKLQASNANTTSPNIIIIGIDSFTQLHLDHNPDAMPRLRALLDDSAVFTNTLTPLARTFPAWTSIVTGKYPVHSGARFNLTDFDQVETQNTLPRILKNHGYSTIYAQDERKFNNMDETFGFDFTIGPKPGAAEFILTKISDFPLVNLALLSPVSESLFPFIYNNRADAIHYSPEDFTNSLIRNLPNNTDTPFFLAAHFCLAHYPYLWRNENGMTNNGLTTEQKHIHALSVLESEIFNLLDTLKQQGKLENTLLVLLSDHGETLDYEDAIWAKDFGNSLDKRETDGYAAFSFTSQYNGHGTNMLDQSQYISILAFHGFGKTRELIIPGLHDELASLVDVSPSILGRLNFETMPKIDGIDLFTESRDADRNIPTETGIRFSALNNIQHIDENQLVKESSLYYQVDPKSARLVIKPDLYQESVASKDLAIHHNDWMIALLRKKNNPYYPYVTILVHKPTGRWTIGNDLSLIKQAPIQQLKQGLLTYYPNEISDFKETWIFSKKS